MLLTGAHDAAAEALITHIERTSQGPVEVLTDATRLSEAPEGATVVLLNAGRFATWLNLFRTVVRSRRLVLLLWCTAEDVQTLKLHAQDFFDWVSLTVTVPPHEPSFVRDALEQCRQDASALALHHPPSPPAGFSVHALSEGYAAIREAIRAGPVWLTGVHAADELLSALVAHAEAQPRHGLVLADPGVLEVSIRALDARPAPWAKATERLASLGVSSPGVEAARRALNPTQTLAEAPSPVVVVSNEEWTRLLTRVREERIDDETRRLALALGLVAVERVWREERGWGALGDAAPLGADRVLAAVGVDAAGSAGLAAVARSWIVATEGLSEDERAQLERSLLVLALAERSAAFQEPERLATLREEARRLEEAGHEGGVAFIERATALAQLILLAASWLPEDDDAGSQALGALRQMAAQGLLPEAVWAGALLRRAYTCLYAPRGVDRLEEAAALLEEVQALDGSERTTADREVLLGDVARKGGRWEEATARYEAAREVYQRLGHWEAVPAAQGRVADVLEARGQLDEAMRMQREEVLPVAERLGDGRAKALAMSRIADMLQSRGQLDEALRIWRDEVLPLHEQLGDARERAITMCKVADVLQAHGQLDESIKILTDEVLPVFERLGDVRSKAVALSQVTDVLTARGQLDEALRIHSDELLPIFERLGDGREKAATMAKIAEILHARGQLDDAERIYRDEVLPFLTRLGDRQATLVTQLNLAITLLLTRKPKRRAEARALLTEALQSAIALKLPVETKQIRATFSRFNLRPPS